MKNKLFFNYPEIRNFLIKMLLYIKYPYRIIIDIRSVFLIPKMKRNKIVYFPINFIFRDVLNENSIVIDVGCGYKADFSVLMIEKYGAKCYAVDPTHKHQKFLKAIEDGNKEKFVHVKKALGAVDGTVVFNESVENESGSLLKNHVNIKKDNIVTYEVEMINIRSLIKSLNLKKIDLLKIDIEGAEFELIDNLSSDETDNIDQIFVEFHHKAVDKYTKKHTIKAVKLLQEKGFKSFSLNGTDFLFYKL